MKDTDRKAYNIVQPNSFAYNPARINVGSIGYYKGVENVIVSSLYEVFQTDNYVNDRFLWHWFKSDEFPRWIERLQEGSVRLYFYYDKLCECRLYMPSLEEQEKIASFLDALDRLITLHQCKYDTDKNRESFAWEQRKLGEITELKSASRVHKDEWTSNGVPFYRSSDVMAAINGTENEKAFISEELYEKLSKVSGKLEEGDILVTGGGSVGNPYIVPDNKPLYTKDADLLWIKNKGKFHPYFLYEFFFSPTFRNYLGSISHVGTIAHYTITQLSDTPICLPSFEEQKKVGEYFQSLDHLITLHHRKHFYLKIATKTLKITIQLTKGGRKNVRIGVNDREKTD